MWLERTGHRLHGVELAGDAAPIADSEIPLTVRRLVVAEAKRPSEMDNGARRQNQRLAQDDCRRRRTLIPEAGWSGFDRGHGRMHPANGDAVVHEDLDAVADLNRTGPA